MLLCSTNNKRSFKCKPTIPYKLVIQIGYEFSTAFVYGGVLLPEQRKLI